VAARKRALRADSERGRVMTSDTVTEVTKQSWFSRIGGAIKGVAFGFVLFVLAFPLLFWNEGRAVERQKTLEEGSGSVVSVAADSIDPANDGKLVHASGTASTVTTLTDSVFGVSASALKLKRTVEMYQWQESSTSETKDKIGGGQETVTTYSYATDWSSTVVNSANFKEPTGHQNPGAMAYESEEFVADPVVLGAFTLSPSLVSMIGGYQSLALPSDTPVPAALKYKAKLQGNGFYVGANPSAPQVGDLRVTFELTPFADVSVIAQQTGDTFVPYQAESGGTIQLLQTGIRTADEMIEAAEESNKVMTWVLRLVGLLLMFFGLTTVLRPLSVGADVLPVLGNLVGAGVGIISFLIAAALSLTTIAIAWVFFRPVVGFIILAVVVGLIVTIVLLVKSARQKVAAQA